LYLEVAPQEPVIYARFIAKHIDWELRHRFRQTITGSFFPDTGVSCLQADKTIVGGEASWCTERFKLEQLAPQERSAEYVTKKKLQVAQSRFKLAQTRLKRATILAAKWERRVNYYENRLAKIKGEKT
jgi:hypothetical protein